MKHTHTMEFRSGDSALPLDNMKIFNSMFQVTGSKARRNNEDLSNLDASVNVMLLSLHSYVDYKLM